MILSGTFLARHHMTCPNYPNGYCGTRSNNYPCSAPLIPRAPTLTPDDAQKTFVDSFDYCGWLGANNSALFRITNFSPTSTSSSGRLLGGPDSCGNRKSSKKRTKSSSVASAVLQSQINLCNRHNHPTHNLPSRSIPPLSSHRLNHSSSTPALQQHHQDSPLAHPTPLHSHITPPF